MKKVICLILSLVEIVVFSSCSINSNKIHTEWDGEFLYYYNKEEDCYTIAGMTENLFELPTKENEELIVPTHYKGKPIKKTVYRGSFRKKGSDYFRFSGLTLLKTQKVYLSYLIEPYQKGGGQYWLDSSSALETYIINTQMFNIRRIDSIVEKPILYLTKVLFDKMKQDEEEDLCETVNSYTYLLYEMENIFVMVSANTAYMFNYEDSPNEDYFFINNFERGGKIENTPYEPIRDGYTFTGWYKDEDCTEKWNFETDILPKWEYDEDGNEIFVETKLYAGWRKNN